ncbi:MAG: hypothetical protein DME50_10685 [Verrucomicrobia bacterium]|jgi:hypothetical protein|nr:MAG: hypothetical protein DME50_10685 [Verrucomicrobiota bacterium]
MGYSTLAKGRQVVEKKPSYAIGFDNRPEEKYQDNAITMKCLMIAVLSSLVLSSCNCRSVFDAKS